MSIIKNILAWCVGIFIFGYVMYQVELYEEAQEKKCTDKGMILISPIHDKPYCSIGVRP